MTDERANQSIDACDLPCDDNSLDCILCFSALEHIAQTEKALREFSRCLKHCGVIIVTTPWFFPYHATPYDFFRWSREGISQIMTESGFQKVDIKAGGNFFLSIGTFLLRPSWSRNFKGTFWSPCTSFALRILGLILLIIGSINSKAEDDNYAILYSFIYRNISTCGDKAYPAGLVLGRATGAGSTMDS